MIIQMSANLAREISDLLLQTRSSLDNAYKGNWDQVISDEHQRRQMIFTLFSQPLDAREVENYRDIIQEVLLLNSKLEQITADARDRVRDEAGLLGKGRHAIDMYSENIS
jgi:Flagellar protein FliT